MKMDASSSDQCVSSLNCEVNIIRAKNIDFINKKSSSSGNLFVRCYLSSGNGNQRVQLNTKEIPSSSSTKFDHDFFWNQCFSLECLGKESSIISLRQEGMVVFELRWRRSNISEGSFLGKYFYGGSNSSKLLAKAEIPLKKVFESTNMEIETWVQMNLSKNHNKVINQEEKPPKLQIRMKVEVPNKKIIHKRRRLEEEESSSSPPPSASSSSSCGCKDGCGCKCVDYIDYDFFGLGFAL